jgi:predicted ATPase/DNA-binding SARP family transcriptional activator
MDTPGPAPTVSSVDAHPSLPAELTRFIGREQELADLGKLLDRSRLVTLTGAAGSGKTRLALELVTGQRVARQRAWVELASLRDPGLMAPAVAEATGLREEVGTGDLKAVARLLQRRPLLLVLDNCEHLVDACAELVDTLLRDCPDLTVLATSREALGVQGERAWLVPPLEVPEGRSLAEAEASEAVRLFVERASDVVPDFRLTAENAPIIVEICRRLDGIPLAIELAAARVKVLAPLQIRDRLDDVFRLLSAGGRTAVPRHRTLRAAIDWSHDLLRPDARVLLRRFSVFRGGFTLDAAERVGAGDGIAEADVLDLLAGLVDRSLVGVREQHGATRYYLLEALRQYATQMLVEAGPAEERATRERFVRWVAGEVADAEPHFIRTTRRARVNRLYPELDNIRSALGWTREHDPALHVQIAGMLWWFWFSTQHWTEGGRWIEGALTLPEATAPTIERARLLFASGALSALQARGAAARAALQEAADIAGRSGDGRLEAYALNYLGMTFAGEGSVEALGPCRRAESWFREHDDLYGLRLALLLQGSMALGGGNLPEAERLNVEGVRVARRFGQPRELAVALQNLAGVHIAQGRLDEAELLVREAFAASRRDPSYYFIATGVAYLGEIEGRRGRHLEAGRLLGFAEATRDAIGARPFPIDRIRQDSLVATLRSEAGATSFEQAWQEGRLLDPMAVLAEESRETGSPVVAEVAGAAGGITGAAGSVAGAAGSVAGAAGSVAGAAGSVAGAAGSVAGAAGSVAGVAGSVAGVGARDVAARPAMDGEHLAGSASAAPIRPVQLQVQALGPVVVSVEGETVEAGRWVYAKPRELLLYLLLHPRGANRDQIGEALWPGAARSNVKNSFHVTLHHVRKALGRPEWIVRETDRYLLDPQLSIAFDADEFESAARHVLRQAGAGDDGAGDATTGGGKDEAIAVALRHALELYRGDLMEGEPCGRWIDDHRDRLRRLYLDVGMALGSVMEPDEPDGAAALYEALVAREELDEELHRRLMGLRARSGDRVRALRHYERLVALLQGTLDAEPEPETVALYDRIRAGAM